VSDWRELLQLSAGSPATGQIDNRAIRTMKVVGGGSCEWDKFNTTNGTFISPHMEFLGDAGIFSQTDTTIDMTWTAGDETGPTFQGTRRGKYCTGPFGGIQAGLSGKLVRGAIAIC
jgi:hypothetical protein